MATTSATAEKQAQIDYERVSNAGCYPDYISEKKVEQALSMDVF